MIRTTRNTVHAWAHAEPDEIAKRFHNLMLRQDVVFQQTTRQLLWLFADQAPTGRGRYNHHDGYRS